MAFRNTTFIEHCVVCEAKANTSCKRCRAPLCKLHRPQRSRRCDACEADFDRRLAKIPQQEDYTLTDQTHSRFGKALAISAVSGLVGLFGAIASMALTSWGIFLIPFILMFFFSTFVSLFVIPPLWILASSSGHAASLGSRIRAALARSSTRRAFLREQKQPLLEEKNDP